MRTFGLHSSLDEEPFTCWFDPQALSALSDQKDPLENYRETSKDKLRKQTSTKKRRHLPLCLQITVIGSEMPIGLSFRLGIALVLRHQGLLRDFVQARILGALDVQNNPLNPVST